MTATRAAVPPPFDRAAVIFTPRSAGKAQQMAE